MKKMLKRLCTGFLALATVVTALPTTPVHAESKQYWTESKERVGIVEKVMNDGSIGSTFNEGYMKVEGETAYCIDINTDFKNGYKTRADASSRMNADQISDVALSLEYVKQYGEAHKELNYKQVYLLEQCVVWQRLSVHLGWQCDNVRASYNEIPKATQDEVFSGAKAFVKENKGRYECGGYIYSGEGQELGQFWAKLNVGNAKLQKTSSNTSITDGNEIYSIAGATYTGLIKRETSKALHAVINFVVVFVLSASFIAYAPDYIKKINEFSSDISTASLDLGTKIMLPNSDSEGKDSVDLIRDSLFSIQVEQPWLLLQFGNSNAEEIGTDRVEALVSASPEDEDGKTREEVVKTEIEDKRFFNWYESESKSLSCCFTQCKVVNS